MITGAITTWTAEKVGEFVQDKFKESVIERWTRYRAKRFFEAFCSAIQLELQPGCESQEASQLLDNLLSDETRSEILFDAYRKVAFCASKEIGPKIIGLLVGELFSSGQRATESEEKILLAAEQMNDSDLYSFLKLYRETEAKMENGDKDIRKVGVDIELVWHEEHLDSNWPTKEAVDVGGLDAEMSFGTWALKLKQLGFLKDSVSVRHSTYREDSERHIDQDGELTTYRFTYTFQSECSKLAQLIVRAIPSKDAEMTEVQKSN